METMNCKRCGGETPRTTNAKKYCQTCRKELDRQRARRYRAERIQRLQGTACTVDDCESQQWNRELCQAHYNRLYRHGDPLAGGPPRTPPGVRDDDAIAIAYSAGIFTRAEANFDARCTAARLQGEEWAKDANGESLMAWLLPWLVEHPASVRYYLDGKRTWRLTLGWWWWTMAKNDLVPFSDPAAAQVSRAAGLTPVVQRAYNFEWVKGL